MLALDYELGFDPSRADAFFSILPSRSAVFLVELKQPDAEPYLVRTANLRKRLERLLCAPDGPSKQLNLREIAAGIRYRVTGSLF